MAAHTRRIDLEELHSAFKEARRWGVTHSRLVDYSPALIEQLYPAADYPEHTIHDRATAIENLTTTAVSIIGGDAGHALAITLCLTPGTLGRKLDQRRALAAQHLGILPVTWTRGWREPRLFHDLVAEIHRLHDTDPATYLPTREGPQVDSATCEA
ncbi:MAG: hypothetical protein ACR2GH_18040 [Pseudonocardia sp.]